MIIRSLNKILRIIVMICLIIIALESIYFKFGHCDKCDFKVNNESYTASEFVKLYADKCFNTENYVATLPRLKE